MLIKFGSDLTSLLNSDPAWKVAKGIRSSSRRARKIVAENLGSFAGLGCRSSADLSMPVSEAEKHGVSALGCRFSGKAEHVPIKKRRFLFRSPSPPPVIPSPAAPETVGVPKSQDVTDKPVARNCASSDINSSQIIDSNDKVCIKKCDKPDRRFGEDEDFSGISILAAAACSSSLGRECGYAEDGSGVEESSVLQGAREFSTTAEVGSLSKCLLKEDLVNSSEMSTGGTSSCVSTDPVAELASISTAVYFPQKVVAVGEAIKGASVGPDSLTSPGIASCSKEEELVGSQRTSSRDARLHWDLNVVMDAWEEPLDDSGPHDDVSHDTFQCSGKDKLGSSPMLSEPKILTNLASDSTRGIHGKGVCSSVGLSSGKQTALKCMDVDTKCTNDGAANTIDGSDFTGLNHVIRPLASMNETDNVSVIPKFNGNDHLYDVPVVEGSSSRAVISSADLENLRTSSSDATCGTVSADVHAVSCVLSGIDRKQKVEGKAAASEVVQVAVSNQKTLPHPCMSSETFNIISTGSEIPSALDTKGQAVSNIRGGNLVQDYATRNVSEIPLGMPKESCGSHLAETSTTNFDNCSNFCGSKDNAEPGETKPVAGIDATGVVQEGYDSQYEDGELRESNERTWEEYDDVYREAEQVDYGLDTNEIGFGNLGDHQDPEPGETEGRKNGSQGAGTVVSSAEIDLYHQSAKASGEVVVQDDQINLDCSAEEKMKVPRGKELCDSSKSSLDVAAVLDDDGRKDGMLCDADELVNAKDSETGEGTKAFRRALQSRIEGPDSHDESCRDERLKRIETRYESGSMRSFDRGRYSFHNQTRGRQGGNWDGPLDNRRGCRRHYSPINYRRSNDDAEALPERDESGCNGSQDNISYSRQLLPYNRANGDEESSAGLQSRYRHDRKFSPDRAAGFGRGRPFRYGPLNESRGRGRYNGPSPDESFQSSLKYRRPLSRRERSFSPFGGRGQSNMQNSRGKSQSRSRSPIRWNSPRGRPGAGNGANTFNRHRSRSPNFRPEFRMQRLRSPSQQPSFGGERAGGFRSVARTNCSPPPNRWNSARKDDLGNFREFGYKQRTTALERSPGRFHVRGDRDGAIDLPRKPDGYYRFSDRVSGNGAGRGVRINENYEDRRKHCNYLRPVRRSYEEGMANRLHHDIDDSFPVASNFRDREASNFRGRGGFRGTDNRIGDMPRRFRGEQRSFTYERNGKFNTNSNQFRMNEMDSSNSGRYNDMVGENRGRRFDNYEERRKQFGSTDLMRRSDDEVKGERLKCEPDENFQDAPEFCGRGMRAFDDRTPPRSMEDGGQVVCGQVEKLDDKAESVGLQNSTDNDASKGTVPS